MRALLAAVAAVALFAPAAHAGIWTPVESGTTSTITAVEYQSPERFWFTTASGQIYKRNGDGTFSPKLPAATGISFTDIEFQATGSIGLAVGDGGQVYRSDDAGQNWSAISGIPASNEGDGSGNKCTINTPLADVNFVRFAGEGRVWIGAGPRQVSRSAPADPADVGDTGTWTDANRKTTPVAGDNCLLDTPEPLSDIAVGGNPDAVYFFAAGSEAVFYTTNNLISEAAAKPTGAANGNQRLGTAAIDPENPNRLWSVCGSCPYGNSAAIYTEDSFSTNHWIRPTSFDWSFTDGPRDVDFKGGTVLEAGNAGMILTSVNGRDFYLQPADGDLGTQEWRAVGLAGPGQAAVGGANGKLVVSTAANSVPDTVKPTGTIAGPSTGATGQALTFTATLADEAGGSGINAAASNWTTPGLTNQSGPSATFTFPEPGFYTITLSFADNAGNSNTTTKPVEITAGTGNPGGSLPTPVLPSSTNPPLVGGGAKKKGKYIVLKVKGRLGLPAGLTAAEACNGTMSISVYKGKKRLVGKTTKLKKNCGYKKTIKVKRKKVGKAKKLKLKVAFRGNSKMGKLSSTYKVKVSKK